MVRFQHFFHYIPRYVEPVGQNDCVPADDGSDRGLESPDVVASQPTGVLPDVARVIEDDGHDQGRACDDHGAEVAHAVERPLVVVAFVENLGQCSEEQKAFDG